MIQLKLMQNEVTLGFEQTLWTAAEKLRGQIDASEYKHIILGLIFLKYVSDSFQELYGNLQANGQTDAENRDAYQAQNILWIPKQARWSYLETRAKSPEIGSIVNEAMAAIEKNNPDLKGVLPQNYDRKSLNHRCLSELINI